MSSALRTPWLGLVAEKELRFALDELAHYIPGTYFERNNLKCGPDEVRLRFTKKKAIQLIEIADINTASVRVKVSDGDGFITAFFEQECIDTFQKQNQRKFQTIRGAIVNVTNYQLVIRSNAPEDEILTILVSNFRLLGSEGSRTFGEPTSIVEEKKVQLLVARFKDILLGQDDSEDIVIGKSQSAEISPKKVSQLALNTQVQHTQRVLGTGPSFTQQRTRKSHNNENEMSETDEDLSTERRPDQGECTVSRKGSYNSNSQPGTPPSAASRSPSSADYAESNHNGQELVDDESGQRSTVDLKDIPPSSSELQFVDIFESSDPFHAMRRVPRKYVRTSKEQQALLDGNSWYRRPTLGSTALATLPTRVTADILTFVGQKHVDGENNRIASPVRISTTNSGLRNNAGKQLLREMTPAASQQSDDDLNDRNTGSDARTAESAQPSWIPSSSHLDLAGGENRRRSQPSRTPKDHLSLSADASPLVELHAPSHKLIPSESSSPLPYYRSQSYRHYHGLDIDQRTQTIANPSKSNAEVMLDLAVPLATYDLSPGSVDDDDGTALLEHELPLTATNNQSGAVQVERTPYNHNSALSRSWTSNYDVDELTDDLSSDNIIPATHTELACFHETNGPSLPGKALCDYISKEDVQKSTHHDETLQSTTAQSRHDGVAYMDEMRPSSVEDLPIPNLLPIERQHLRQASRPDTIEGSLQAIPQSEGSLKRRSQFRDLHKRIAAQIATEEDQPVRDTFQMSKDTRIKFKTRGTAPNRLFIMSELHQNDNGWSASSSEVATASKGESLESSPIPSPSASVYIRPAYGVALHDDNPTIEQDSRTGLEDAFVQETKFNSDFGALLQDNSLPMTEPLSPAQQVDFLSRLNEEKVPSPMATDHAANNTGVGDSRESYQDFQDSVVHIEDDEICEKVKNPRGKASADLELSCASPATAEIDDIEEIIHASIRRINSGQSQAPRSFPDESGQPLYKSSETHYEDSEGGDEGSRQDEEDHLLTHKIAKAPANPSSSFFDQYKSVYPDYTGSQHDFTLALTYIEYLVDNGIFGHSHMCDDFIRFYPEDYLALQGDKMNISGWELFKKRVKRPIFESDVISSENLGLALASVDGTNVAKFREKFATSELGRFVPSRSVSISLGTTDSEGALRNRPRSQAVSPIVPAVEPKDEVINDTSTGSKLGRAINRRPFFETISQLSKRNEPDPISPPPLKRRKTLPWSGTQLGTPQRSDKQSSHEVSPVLREADIAPQSERRASFSHPSPFNNDWRFEELNRRKTLTTATVLSQEPKSSLSRKSDNPSKRKRIGMNSNTKLFLDFLQKSQLKKGQSVSRASTPIGSSMISGRGYSLIPKGQGDRNTPRDR